MPKHTPIKPIKDSPHILYVDIEEELSYPPDKIVNTCDTGFKDKDFHTIFFDPPHEYGRTKNTSMYTTPNRELCNEKWPEWARKGHPRYYGTDKYKTGHDLLSYISKSEMEFYRILTDDGMLWLKWSENRYVVNDILEFFRRWDVMLKLPIKSVSETAAPTYWICLMKKQGLVETKL